MKKRATSLRQSGVAGYCRFLRGFSVSIIVFVSSIVGCANRTTDEHPGVENVEAETIEEVLEKHTDEWMELPGVVGTAIGESNGNPCIKVFVVENTGVISETIPSEVEGYPVIIEKTGEFRARDK